MGNIISCDPGSPMGSAIFSPHGKLLKASQIVCEGNALYLERLQKIKKHNSIDIAFIEDYYHFPGVVQKCSFSIKEQIGLLKAVFPDFIIIHTKQWNPYDWQEAYKRLVAMDIFGREFDSGHTTDAALMGNNIFQKAQVGIGEETFQALKWLAQTKRIWPKNHDQSLYILWNEYKDSISSTSGNEAA